MTVYVDDMKAAYGRMVMCHMIADSDDELHAMADRIGVSRRWHQAPPKHRSHYDIALCKRALAVKFGAVQITWAQAGAMSGLQRFGLPMGDPATAKKRYLAELERRRAAIEDRAAAAIDAQRRESNG